MQNPDLTPKSVAITGGAEGIGLCLVHAFAEQGAQVAFCDLNIRAGRAAARKLALQGGNVFFTPADVAQQAQVRRWAKEVLRKFQRLDVLINNAGIARGFGTPFLLRSLEEWDRVISANLTSQFLCAQAFARELARSKGSIINIASTRAIMSEPNTEAYSASKGGVVALTHSLAVTLGKKGVRVNCVSPGWIDTSRWMPRRSRARLRKIDHAQHPAGRVGKPEDVAAICLFLANPESSGFITGANIVVDGGMTRKMIYEP